MKVSFALLAVLLMVLASAYAEHKNYYFDSWTRYDSASIKKLMVEIDGRLGVRPIFFDQPGGPFNDAVCLERVDKSVGTLFAEGFNGEILPGGLVLCDQGHAFPIGDTPAGLSYPLPSNYDCTLGYHTANVMELATYLDARSPASRDLHFITEEWDEYEFFPYVSFTQHIDGKYTGYEPSEYPKSYAGIGLSEVEPRYGTEEETYRLCVKNDAPLRFVPDARPAFAYNFDSDREFHLRPEEVNRVCARFFGNNYRGASAGKVASAMKGAFDADATALLLSQGIYIVTPDKTVGGVFPSMIDVRTQCDGYEGKADPYGLMSSTLDSLSEPLWDDDTCVGTYEYQDYYAHQDANFGDGDRFYTTFTSCQSNLFNHLDDSNFSDGARFFEEFSAGHNAADYHHYFGDRTDGNLGCQYYPRLASLDVPPVMTYLQRTTMEEEDSICDGTDSTYEIAGLCGYADSDDFADANHMYVACVREENNLRNPASGINVGSSPFSANAGFFGTSFEEDETYYSTPHEAYGPNENSNAPNQYYIFGGDWDSGYSTPIPRPFELWYGLQTRPVGGACSGLPCGGEGGQWAEESPVSFAFYCDDGGRNPQSCYCTAPVGNEPQCAD